MDELFAKPAAGGIIETFIDGEKHILIQERNKEDAPTEKGLLEIPAGKIREFENIYDCLKREILEETGLEVFEIEGENQQSTFELNGYKVISYEPFASLQCIAGYYPVMVQIFICKAIGPLLKKTNETQNIQWVSIRELKQLLQNNVDSFFPMHVSALWKYIELNQ